MRDESADAIASSRAVLASTRSCVFTDFHPPQAYERRIIGFRSLWQMVLPPESATGIAGVFCTFWSRAGCTRAASPGVVPPPHPLFPFLGCTRQHAAFRADPGGLSAVGPRNGHRMGKPHATRCATSDRLYRDAIRDTVVK